MNRPASERLTLIATNTSHRLAAFARDVRQGLTSNPKSLSCCYFYDGEGSLLFEEICELPEYYLTRAEREILEVRAPELAARFPDGCSLVELGSGNAAKTRLLIEAFLKRQQKLRYVPIDICRVMLEQSSLQLLEEYPRLEILAFAAEYQEALRQLQSETSQAKLILFLGSNIGNFHRPNAGDFLRSVRHALGSGDSLLVGIDLRKDCVALEQAYDDPQGVTADFNLNLLARINRELGGHFDLQAFQHRAVFNERPGRIEIDLVSQSAQTVRIDNLNLDVTFTAGEAIHTEDSYKYSLEEIETLATISGLNLKSQWFDSRRRFSVNLFARS